MSDIEKTPEYFSWIGELKRRYRATQIKAAVSVNTALLEFYWSLGKDICERYAASRSGNKFYQMLSADLRSVLPEAKGLSPSNLKYCGCFYRLYAGLVSNQQVVDLSGNAGQQVVDLNCSIDYAKQVASHNADIPHFVEDMLVRIPWGHHVLIINKCKGDVAKALFYVRKTVENGWSRNVLAVEIDSGLYARQGRAVTNFALTMPEPDSDLAQQLTKDPYIFEVQGLAEKYRETELTRAMCDNIVKLLNAMGKGLAFVGREHVNAPLAKYLLGKIDMPIGVSDYELLRKVPDDFKSQLPTIEEIEAELANMERDGK